MPEFTWMPVLVGAILGIIYGRRPDCNQPSIARP
jgi:hypothetical protein